MSQFMSQASFLIVMTALIIAFGLEDVVAAQVSQAVDTVWSGTFFYLSWKLMESVPPRHVLTQGKSLLAEGFLQTARTVKEINRTYKKGTRWYFLGLIFAESGANSFTVVSVVYLVEHLKFGSLLVGIFFLVTLFFTLPGSILAVHVNKKLDPKRSYRLVMVVLFFWASIGAIVMDHIPYVEYLSFVWGAGIGICLGWFYPTEDVFFSMSLPKGQEAELAGFFVYCSQILGWLPPLVFSIMVEAEASQTYGVIAVTSFLLIAAGIVSCAAPWPEILEECGRSPNGQGIAGNGGVEEAKVVES